MIGKVLVIGTGSWGTAAAGLAAVNCAQVVLWARSLEVARGINATRKNPRHLRSYLLPSNVTATHDRAEAACGAEAVVVAVPSNHLRSVLKGFTGLIDAEVPVVVLTKGIEPTSHLLMCEVVADVLGGEARVCALSGPNHAEEISQGMVSAAVVGSASDRVAGLFQELFLNPHFRVYRTDDLRGVEVCAAVKNVIAIACGLSVGYGMGDNATAVLMTRGLAEMSRVVHALGGNAMTCMGLAGMGDLVVTCSSGHSRNRTFGVSLARGATLEGFERSTGMVVEGARAVISVRELSRELHIETPITAAVHAILYEGQGFEDAARTLLARIPDEEFYGLPTNE
ncbi:NAD(P)H-dependent glycerol-3-phosphate dehydrogenase [Olsenella massiliensis]|uniref:NAD(P)H-dependent glycerol-3-phosphate dehydrogenase n=1 Tax=Olsenella massiliensis TaxID=1622075 RepID=UPI0009EC4991|nr:NAD(P)H-dependent glycerol-3-phosphate dehydrogenase [Olsenella massiliensis]